MPKKTGKTRFKVRNRLHKVKGPYTEAEILSRISKGKFSGQEEVSQPPYETWQSLASVPQFYDAFLKKLFEEKYRAPSKPEDQGKPEDKTALPETQMATVQKGEATRAPKDIEVVQTRALEPLDDKTRQISPEDVQAGSPEVDPDLLRDLFSQSKSLGAKSAEGEESDEELPKTGVAPLEPTGGALLEVSGLNEMPEKEVPLVFDPRGEEEVAKRRKKREASRQRQLLLIIVLLISLGVLFYGGNPETTPKLTEVSDEAEPKTPLLPSTVSKVERAKILVVEATELYDRDTVLSYYRAVDLFRLASRLDAENEEALGKLVESAARFLPNSEDPKRYLARIEELIAKGRLRSPHSSAFYRAEALVALANGDQEKAKQLILNAVESDPHSLDNAIVLAEISFAIQDYQSAYSALKEALQGQPKHVRGLALLSEIAYATSQKDKAALLAGRVLKVNPIHPRSYALLGKMAREKKDIKAATLYYQRASKFTRFSSRDLAQSIFTQLGELYRVAGRTEDSKDAYRMAYFYAKNREGAVKQRVTDLDVSEQALLSLRDQLVFGRDYFVREGENLVSQKKYNESLSYFLAAYQVDPNDAGTLFRLGESLENVAVYFEDFKRVISLYERAIEKNPSLVAAYIKLGLLETEQYNLDRAFTLLNQAVALAPDAIEPYLALGKHFYTRQDYRQSHEQFKQAQNIKANHSETLYYAGLLLRKEDPAAISNAMGLFYNAFLTDPFNYEALVEWLKLKVARFEKAYAINFVNNLREKDPKNPNLFWALGEIYAANKEYRRGISFFHRALDIDNRSSRVRMALGRSLEAVGELDKAVAEYRLASLLDRRNPKGFFRAGELLYQQRKYKKAQDVLNFLIGVSPNFPGAHRYLARIYQAENKQTLALKAMQREVKNNPRNPKYRIELAQLFMDYRKFKEAIGELTYVTNLPTLAEAPKYTYDKIRAYLLLSRSYRALNRFDSAEGAVALARKLDEGDSELIKELGYVYVGLQRDKAAVKAFKQYLSRNPAARDAPEIRRRIKQLEIEE